MKRLINNGDIFDKYVSFEDKKFRDETLKEINWQGHRRIAATYKGAAYSTSLADNFMADSLRNDSNPKGSLLQAAKNYTDEKVATAGTTLYRHFITLEKHDLKFTFNYFNNTNSVITYSKFLQILANSPISGSGYFEDTNGLVSLYSVEKQESLIICQGIRVDNNGMSLNIDGFTISDKVSQVI